MSSSKSVNEAKCARKTFKGKQDNLEKVNILTVNIENIR